MKLLPNLKNLDNYQNLSVLLPTNIDDDEIPYKLYNITEFRDSSTSLTSLCPEKKVIENLWKSPFLTEIQLRSSDPYFVSELRILLNIIGKQIISLTLKFPLQIVFDPTIVHELCPELVKLEINWIIYNF